MMRQLAFSTTPALIRKLKEIAGSSNSSISGVIHSILEHHLTTPPSTAGTPRKVARVVAELPKKKQELIYQELSLDAEHYRAAGILHRQETPKRRGRPKGSKNKRGRISIDLIHSFSRRKVGRPRKSEQAATS